MGRPLNKKFFGNFNIGTGGYTPAVGGNTGGDDGIGGEGLASLNITNGGNYINRLPTLATLAAPSIPGGVQAAGVLHSVAINASPNTKGTGYQIGDVITDANGSQWRVTKLRVLSAALNTAGASSTWDGTEWIVWDQFVNSHWTSPTILKGVTANGGHVLTGYNAGASVYGVWDGTDGTHAPTTALTIVGGPTGGSQTPNGYNTRASGDYNGSGVGDNNGSGGSVTFTYGVEAVELVSSVDYAYGTTYAYGASNTQASVTPTGGTGVKLDVGFAADHIAVTEKGSGYRGTEAVTFTTAPNPGEVRATGTIVLTTDSGSRVPGANYNVDTNQDNAIIIHANVAGGGAAVGDIQKQVGSRRYKVRTDAGIGRVNLVASNSPATGEAYILATDQGGATYWVVKLTSRRATLVPRGDGSPQFPLVNDDIATTGDIPVSAGWTFGSAIANKTVTIENA
jgi:hypothetical protein